MEILIKILSVLVGIVLLNVWILRFGKSTDYRGGGAGNMKEEFAVYGLPLWSCYAIGLVKITIGVALLLSLWFPLLIQPAAAILAVLMLGAVFMHLKIKDPLKRALPSLALLLISIFLAIFG